VETAVRGGLQLPEFGPALGRLVLPGEVGGVAGLLAPVRIALVTRVLTAAGEARKALAAGDEAAARAALQPTVWATLWDQAAEESSAVLTAEVDRRITEAAASARMPARRLERHRVTPQEHRAMHARLGAVAGALLRAAASLDGLAGAAWANQALATARRLESAWGDLVTVAERELAEWEADVQAVAAWKRARWPLWAFSGTVLIVATCLGLIVGGYLPVPAFLRPFAEFWWGRW
jgi:hypothetical protein